MRMRRTADQIRSAVLFEQKRKNILIKVHKKFWDSQGNVATFSLEVLGQSAILSVVTMFTIR